MVRAWIGILERLDAVCRCWDWARAETDFLILRAGRPWLAIEATLTEQPLDAGLRYLLERVAVPHAPPSGTPCCRSMR